jgi:hypothetical protein
MAFTVQEYLDLVRLLAEHPEWRAELRRLLLSDDVLALPAIVRDLAAAQQRTEERLGALTEAQQRTEERIEQLEGIVQTLAEAQQRTEERLGALAEAQRRTEARLERLEGVVQTLAEAQQRTEARLDMLVEAQQRTEEHLERLERVIYDLAEAQRRTEDRLGSLADAYWRTTNTVGDLKGRVLEITYRDKASAYFGPLLRRLRVVAPYSLEETLETYLSPEEFKDLLLLDLLVSGQPRHDRTLPEVWLAIEISAVVDQEDVDRARRRAMLLRQVGYRAIPVVAGEQATLGAEAAARQHNVAMLQDGRIFLWEEALRSWVAQ